MATYDAADLLAKVRTECRQPSTADFPADADIYEWLSRGQSDMLFRLSVTVPESQYGAPVLLVSADGGFTFPFGTDTDGNAIYPIGAVEIYRTLESVDGTPGDQCSSPNDFLQEGDLIRVPNNRPWSGPGPYARFLTPALKLSASVPPVLVPVEAREALIYYAAAKAWRVLGKADHAAEAQQDYEQCFARNQLAMRIQWQAGQDIAGLSTNGRWYAGFGTRMPLTGG